MRNALKIQPRRWFPRPYSLLICIPAIEMFVRSRNATPLRTKSQKASKNLTRVWRSKYTGGPPTAIRAGTDRCNRHTDRALRPTIEQRLEHFSLGLMTYITCRDFV